MPSGIYFSRIRARGKLIRRSLKTNQTAVAKLRLGDLEKVERQQVEIQGTVESGNMRFGDSGLLAFYSREGRAFGLVNRARDFGCLSSFGADFLDHF